MGLGGDGQGHSLLSMVSLTAQRIKCWLGLDNCKGVRGGAEGGYVEKRIRVEGGDGSTHFPAGFYGHKGQMASEERGNLLRGEADAVEQIGLS